MTRSKSEKKNERRETKESEEEKKMLKNFLRFKLDLRFY